MSAEGQVEHQNLQTFTRKRVTRLKRKTVKSMTYDVDGPYAIHYRAYKNLSCHSPDTHAKYSYYVNYIFTHLHYYFAYKINTTHAQKCVCESRSRERPQINGWKNLVSYFHSPKLSSIFFENIQNLDSDSFYIRVF